LEAQGGHGYPYAASTPATQDFVIVIGESHSLQEFVEGAVAFIVKRQLRVFRAGQSNTESF
jgi:hypothetical protein